VKAELESQVQQMTADHKATVYEAMTTAETIKDLHSGVTAMVDLLITDLEKEMTEGQTDEKNAQAEYETMMADSRDKRAADAKAIADKEGVKAELESQVQQMTADHKATLHEAMATAETIKDLHLECDWLMSNFAARKEARAGEVDSLKKAKAVLSGADYAL